ncbi:hypothetical protein MMC29_004330 [Sticta canariensis]|nr:hypothetical protein [Sticta canariensis]
MKGRQITAAGLIAQAAANGYKRGAHKEQDKTVHREKHVKKTRKDQDATLNRYVIWHLSEMEQDAVHGGLPALSEEAAREQCLRPGIEAPDLATVKDFIRFYIATSHPQLAEQPTVDSINTVAEWFFAGFTRVTGTGTDAEQRSEVYDWVRKVLTVEGLVVKKHRPKHNFTNRDLNRVSLTVWSRDDLIFIHERYRIQFTFIIRVYCWTGARLGAFFTNGLRYRDIDIVLQRRWVKNNRDPENVVFNTAGREHEKFVYNDAAFLLVMAIADGALFGYETLDDLRAQEIPVGENELPLRFKESALNQPILRKCTMAKGVTDEPMPKAAFTEIYGSTMRNAGYLCGTSIHAIRRQLGKKVDERYTKCNDRSTSRKSYVANTSSVDGQAAFLGESTDHAHIDYFQGLEKFHEPGLPCQLPAYLEHRVNRDPRLLELERTVREHSPADPEGAKEAKRSLAVSCRKTLTRLALRRYQEEWVRERRDWKVLTRGKEQPRDLCTTDLVHNLCLLIPERGRLAQLMASDEPLSPGAMWDAMRDLHSLCSRDFSVLYLPGHEPLDGSCPVKLHKNRRNLHVQACLRRELASKHGRLQSEICYCHQCFKWVVGDKEWIEHCKTHLEASIPRSCGTITHCHTLVRPGYCPFCLGREALPANQRMESWSRDHRLWNHVNDHLRGCCWPLTCPHPSCDSSLEDEASFQFHMIDEHRFSRTRPGHILSKIPEEPCAGEYFASSGDTQGDSTRKRKPADNQHTLTWTPPVSAETASPLKKARITSPTVCPSLVLSQDTTIACNTPCPEFTDSSSTTEPFLFDVDSRHSSPTTDDVPLSLAWQTEMSPSRENLPADGVLGDDDMFSQFIRSPSPSCLPSADVDHDDSLTGPTVQESTIRDSSSPDATHNIPNEVPCDRVGPRLRLRVGPPRPKITLRVTKPSAKDRGTRRRSQVAKPKERSRPVNVESDWPQTKRRRGLAAITRTNSPPPPPKQSGKLSWWCNEVGDTAGTDTDSVKSFDSLPSLSRLISTTSSRTKDSTARIRKHKEISEVARVDGNTSQVRKLRSIPADGWKPDSKKAARDKVARDKVARDKVARNKVARNKVARNKVARNKIARNRVTRNKVAPDACRKCGTASLGQLAAGCQDKCDKCQDAEIASMKKEWDRRTYPMIDWAILPERLRNYIPFLLDVLSGRFQTPFLQRYKDHIENLKDYGTDMTRSGYYGPRGESFIADFILLELREPLQRARQEGLIVAYSIPDFVLYVLTPTMVLRLIMDHMSLDMIRAHQVMVDSARMGMFFYDDDITLS